jgi:hypothetical protein
MAFDPVTEVLSIGSKLIDRLWPDPAQAAQAKLKMLDLQQTGELAQLTATTELAKAQAAINQQEAASGSLFVAGWRPFVGWCCGAAFAYAFVLQPFATFILAAFHAPLDPKTLPVLDMTSMLPVLMGMLGLGAMRSYEKVQGASNAQ